MPRNARKGPISALPAFVPLAIVLLLCAGMIASAPAGAAPLPLADSAGTIVLRVMNINIFYGGDELDLKTGSWCKHREGCPETLAQVIAAIRAARPDVVALEEGEHNTRPIAEALGWNYSERMQILSRLPLIDPPGGDGVYIFVQLAPGRVAALMNVHLPADPYGPYLVRDGAPLEEVLDLENSLRLPAIQDQLRALPGLTAAGIPVFLTGDFNSPSHLDWTAAVDAAREDVRYPIDWPVGLALARAGFRDSYRTVHSDPVAVPGFTWTPGGPESVRDEVHDRIDWVLAAGAANPVRSDIVGEPGNPDVGIAVDPYPTDHRGVVTTFEVTPGVAPIFVAASSRRLSAGDTLRVVFHAPGRRGERVAIVPAGGGAATAVASQPTGGGAPIDGTVSFATAALAPAAYEAALVDGSGAVLSRSPFWLYAAGAPSEVATTKATYALGEPIEVTWRNAPGMRWDWLGIFSPGDSNDNGNDTTCNVGYCGSGRYLVYVYTRTAIEGSTTFSSTANPGWVTWPISTGSYEIRLLLDDGYRTVATSAPFKVVQP